MASSYPSSSSRRTSTNYNKDADADLLQSLNQLSLSASSPAKSPRSPKPGGPFKPPLSRSPSSLSVRSNAPRSPLSGPSPSNGRDSRSATPTLLRKASLNSLHSHSVNGVAPPRRASSVNIRSPSLSRSPLRSMSPEPPEKPPVTAASIASAHFRAELELHHGPNSATPAETVVILHDSCYGHRYSRPRTSRAALSTIVERPERIKASVLGLATAYVRLGERHAEGAVRPHPKLDVASLPSIPFRIQKTTRRLPLMSATVTNVHGTKWMEELKIMCDSAEAKLAMNGKELQRPEINRGPDHEAPKKLHEGDLYLCSESLEALEGALGAVCEAVDAVFLNNGLKRAFVAIRPPGHHCSASYPSGFCWLNNVHVGIMHGILSHGLTHAAIIDFDLHHGDGSQGIAWQHNSRGVGLSKNAAWWKKTSIGYFSLHDINSYPCEMGDEEKVKNASLCIDNAHGQNIWNVHLESWKSEAEFWKLYESKYSVLLEKARKFLKEQTERLRAANQNAKAAIFFSAGFDASEWESSGMQRHKVNVPTEFYARIARDVTKIAEEEGTSVEGRIISVLEGGYSDRALTSGVLSHLSGLAGGDPVTSEEAYSGLGFQMGQRIGSVHARTESLDRKAKNHPYEPSWWELSELERLESAGAPVETEPKKPRNVVPPTYSSPTQSSSAKIVAVPKVRRSLSGLGNGSPVAISRPPSPPPPEVPWTVAAHELCNILVPTNRTTGSCQPEDLSAEATRVRREKQSALAGESAASNIVAVVATPTKSRMALRERKPAKTIVEEDEKPDKNRRKTVAGTPLLATEKTISRGSTPVPGSRQPTRQAGRRLSAASTIVSETPDPRDLGAAPANGASGSESSINVRPGSAMSTKTTAGGPLAVKKTRTANPVKKDAPKAPRTKKASAAPIRNTPASSSSASSSTSVRQTSGPSTAKTSDDVDKITTGMRKIKINLVTKAQREAREREAEKAKKGRSSRSASPVKVEEPRPPMPQPQVSGAGVQMPPPTTSTNQGQPETPTLQAVSQDQFILPAPTATSGPVTPNQEQPPALSPMTAHRVPLPPSSPAQAPEPVAQSTPDMFINYQPEGPAPAAIPQHESLKWLPPNTGTPMSTPSPMKRADLPMFTATSAIPFAARSAEAGVSTPKLEPTVKPESKPPNSIWEVPETPQK